MKKGGTLLVGTGAIVIVFLMISNATAVPMANANKADEIHVDPHIRITKNQLPLLRKALEEIDDPNDVEFVNSLIKIVKTKGEADHIDIRNILRDKNLGIIGIHSGFVNGNGHNDGATYLIRGPIKFLLFWIEHGLLLRSWHFLGTIVFWKSYGENPVRVNLRKYDTPHIGVIIGFVGIESTGGSPWDGVYYRIIGLGMLIIVKSI